MDQGDRAPKPESAASTVGRASAIDAAFAAFPEFSADDVSPAATSRHAETPDDDDRSGNASVKPAPAPDPGAETEDPSPTPEGQPALPASKDALEAPKHWPKDRRDQFQTLPDDAKRIVLDRNKEANVAVTKSQQEAAQYRRTHESVGSLFNDDHRRQMQSAGLDDIGAVRYLVQQHDALNRDPVGFIKAVIAQSGLKAEQIFGAQQPAQPNGQPQPAVALDPDEWVDPAVVELRAKLAKLEEVETSRQRQAQDHQRNEQARYNNWFAEQCDAFENAIDDDGNAKYPHLPAVIGEVIRLVSDPAAKSLLHSKPHEALERAYNDALYLNPQTRQQVIDADFQRRLGAQDSANAVKKAQAAATRKGSPGASGLASAGRMTIEDAVSKAMRDAGM